MKGILVEKVRDFLITKQLILPNDRVLLGVSGGPDSTAMLFALNELKDNLQFEVAIATFNHSLRREAAYEVEFVRSIASELAIPFFTERKNVQKTATDNSMSIEQAARLERLDFLFRIKKKGSFNKIALAHTLDDQVETVLFHLLKGAGSEGLAGIRAKSFDGIIHPFLEITKKEILTFLDENNLKYVQDKSNLSLSYERNRIRMQLVPLMQSFNPSFKLNLISTVRILQAEDDYLQMLAKKDYEALKQESCFSKVIFNNLPLSERRRILKTILGKAASFDKIEAAIDFLETSKRKFNLPSGNYLISDRKSFWIETSSPFSLNKQYQIKIPGTTSIEDIDLKIIATITDKHDMKFDNFNVAFPLGSLALPLMLRFRKEGDFIVTEKGTKKLQDIFVDSKIKRDERYKVPIIVDGNDEVLWIVGLRRTANYKIVKQSAKILALKAIFNKNLFLL
ncbi:MAG: tRNA lysidine(34) synthetase TilS [Caldisericaceae bacterium]